MPISRDPHSVFALDQMGTRWSLDRRILSGGTLRERWIVGDHVPDSALCGSPARDRFNRKETGASSGHPVASLHNALNGEMGKLPQRPLPSVSHFAANLKFPSESP